MSEDKKIDARSSADAALTADDALVQARARRLAALQATFGLWANRTDIPKDGVEHQNQLRSEWD